MSERMNRREWLGGSAALLAGVAAGSGVGREVAAAESAAPAKQRRYRLGMVTYRIAHNWDLQTIIDRYKEIGLACVEFRTTHAHGVEPSLSKAERADVKKRCADAGLVIWGVGTACDFHSPDKAVVEKNIDEAKRFCELARDIGARGVKVRPNGFPDGVSQEKTLEQIGQALRRCGEAGSDLGVEIWCEMHGRGTAHPPHMKTMVDIADRPNVGVVWNSNRGIDEKDGSIREHFMMLRPKILSVHINELINDYPYRELFGLLRETGYDRYTLIEARPMGSANVDDNVRFVKFYKALWEELSMNDER